jgi:hypothetical protein
VVVVVLMAVTVEVVGPAAVLRRGPAIAAFPPFYSDLNDALACHVADAMQKLTPEEALERRRSARATRTLKDKLPFLNKDEEREHDVRKRRKPRWKQDFKRS